MNKGIFRFQVFRRRRAACKLVATISAFAMLCVASLPAFAGESLLGGNAVLEKLTRVTMSENTADALTFESSSPVGVLDWTKFNIGLNQRMSFNGAASTFFNLVDGAAGKSQIDGMINGTAGGVWVINPSGVAFGANAIVNLEGVFAAAAGTVNNADDLRDGSATTPTFGSFGGAVDVGASTFTADRIALLGKSVSVDGANFKSVGSVSIGAADKMAVVDDVAGGKVTINISDFTDDTDVLKDIAVDLGDVDFGDTGHAGNLTVVTEGSISVKGAVKAESDIVFKTLAAEGASAPVISYKQMSVASGKLLQGKSASATAAGRVAVDGDVTATGGDVEVTAGSYVNVGTAATVESKTGDVTINAVGNVNMGGTVAAAESVVLKATGGVDETAKSVKVGFDSSSYNPNASVSGKNVTMEGKMSSQVLAGSVAATESVTMSGGEYVAVNGAVSGKGVTLETTDRATLSKDHSELGLKKDDPAGILVTDDGSVTAVDSLAMTSKGIISADGVVKVTSESAKVSLGAEGGEIAFSNDGNVIKGTVDVIGGNVDIKGDSNDFDYGKVAADGSGNITLQGNGKDVTIKDSVEASGTFTVNDAEDIALKDDVQVGAAVLTASKTIEQDTGKKLEAKDGITLTAGEGVTLKGSVNADTDGENGGNLVVMKNDTDNGDLLQDGGEIRANELTAAEFTQTGDGKLYANVINADVQQNGCEIVDNGDKTITVNGDFTQADGTLGASDTVQITINGVLEQNAVNSDPDRALIQADEVILNDAATQGGELAGDTIKAMTLTVNAEGKDISLASAANEVGALQGKGDDVSVTTSTALDLGALEAESLTVRAGGSVSQPGSAVVEGLVDITAEYSDGSGANVALLGTENQFGSVKVKGKKIEIKEKDDVVIAGIDGMILYVEAGPSGDPVEYTKTITQNETGDIKTSYGARFYGSSVKLDNDGNAIGPHFSARADNGDVEIVNNAPIGIENDTYTDVDGVTASGAVKLTAKAGDITMYNGAELSGASIDLTAETGNISLDSGKVLVTAADGAATFSAENGAISVQNADNDFKSVTATAKSVALNDKDDVTVAQATATEGNVVVTAGAKMRVKGDITGESVDLDAGDFVNVAAGKTVKATSGAVDIEAAGNADVIGSVVAESGAVSVKATGAGKSVRVAGTVGGKTGVTLEGDKSVQIGGEVASSDGDVTATAKEFVAIDGGSVTAAKGTATLKTTDAELLTAGGGAATYEAGQLAGVMVGGAAAGTVAAKDVVIESAGSVLVNSGSTVTATAVEEAGGTVAVTANGETEATVATSGITKQGVYVLGTVTADGTLDVTAKGEGGILAEGALVADNGETTLTAENGAIDAQNEANDFKSVTATAKSVALNDKDDISVTEVTATDTTDGDVRIRAATGNLTVADATSAKVSGQDIRLEATEGAITVGARVSGKNVTLVAKGNVTTRKETGVADGALTAAGTGSDLLVESTDGNIELKADATAADTAALLADNGGIHAASVDATAIYAKGKDDVDIDNATGNLITKTGGNVEVEFTDSADHTISYDAEGYVKVSAKGKLTVDSAIAEGEDLKVSEVLWPEDTADKTLIDHENESTQVCGVRAGTSVELESTESGIKVNTAVAAGTTAELKAKTNVEVDGAVVGETGVTLTATDGDITIGSDTAPGAVVKAGAFDIPTDGSAPVIADGDSANLAMTAGKSVTVQNGAKVGASGAATVAANGVNNDTDKVGVAVTGDGTQLVSEGDMELSAAAGSVAVSDKAYVGTHGTLGATAAGDVVVKDAGTNVESSEAMTLSGANVTVTAARVGTSDALGVTATAGDVTVESEATVIAKNDITVAAADSADTTEVVEGNVTVDKSSVTSTAGDVLVGNSTTRIGGSFTAKNGAAVTAKETVSVYASGNATAVKGTGERTEVSGKEGVALDAVGDIDVNGAVVKAGVIDETTGAVGEGPAANLAMTAGKSVTVQNGAKVGASGAATVAANGVNNDTDKVGVAVTGDGTQLVSEGSMALSATAGSIAVSDKAYVGTHGTLAATASRDVVVKDAGTNVESAKAMTLSGVNVAVTSARVGTSDALGVTATAGDVTVESEATVIAKNDITVAAADSADTTDVVEGNVTVDGSSVTSTAGSVNVGNSTTRIDGDFAAQNGAAVTAASNVKVYASGDANVQGAAAVVGNADVALDAVGDIDVNGAVVKAGAFDIPTDGSAPVIADGDSANLAMTAGKSVTVQNGAKAGASGTATVAASGVNNDTDKVGVAVTGDGTQLVSEGDMELSAAAGSVAVSDKAYVGTHGTLGATAAGDVVVKDAGTNVESSEAMTLSGVNVAVTSARVGTSDALGVTATAGDVTVESEATVIAKNDITVAAADSADTTDVVEGNVTVDGSSVTSTAGSVNVGNSTTRIDGDFAAQNGAAVTAEKSVAVYVSGDATAAKGTGERTEVSGKEGVALDAVGDIDVNGAVVKAGVIDETTGAVGEGPAANLTMKAGDGVTVQGAAKVGASGTADIDAGAGGVTVDGSQLVANGAMTVDAEAGAVTVKGGSFVGGNSTVAVGMNKTGADGTASLTVGDAADATGSQLVAKDDLTVKTTGAILAQKGAKIGSDADVTLEGASVTAQTGAKVLAAGDVDIDATGAVTVDAATVAAKGDVLVGEDAEGKRSGSFAAQNGAAVEAAADGGSVKVYAADGVTVADTSSVTAGKDAVLNASKAVQIDGDVLARNGKADVDAGTTMTVFGDGTVKATNGAVEMTAQNAVNATDTAVVEAGTSATVESKAAGDITIDTTGSVAAGGGNVTVDNDNGKVTIKNAAVSASAEVYIDATDAVTIAKGTQAASVTGGTGVDIDTTANGVTVDAASVTATAGDVVVGTDEGTRIGGSFAAQNGAAVEATAGNIKAYANGDAKVLGANTSVTATSGDVVIDAENGVDVDGAAISGNNVMLEANTGVTLSGAASVTTTGPVANGKGNLRIHTEGGGITLGEGTTVSAKNNATILADNGNVTQNTDITATSGTIDIEAADGAIVMKNGTTSKTEGNGNIRYKAGAGITISKINAGTGSVTLDALGDLTASLDSKVTAGGLAIKANKVGEKNAKMKFSVSKLAVNSKTDVYVDNDKSVRVIDAKGDDFNVNRVKANGATEPKNSGDIEGIAAENGSVDLDVTGGSLTVAAGSSVSASASTDLDVSGSVEVDGTVSGATTAINAGESVAVNGSVSGATTAINAGESVAVNGSVSGATTAINAGESVAVNGSISGGTATISAGSDVAFDADGQVSGGTVVITAGRDITQEDASISATGGYVSDKKVNAAVTATGKATLIAENGSIGLVKSGSANYVGVEASSIAAHAAKDVAIADPNGDGIVVDANGIKAGSSAAVHTAGTITGSGTISAPRLTVSAKSYESGTVKVNVGNTLSVNNFNGGMDTLLAIFEAKGGRSRPDLENLPNKTIVFYDGRLLGGDIKIINTLGAIEAFPVQTPELKSEQGIFGNPVFLHDELDVSNPMAVGAIDFLLLDIPRLTLSSDFPLEVEKQVAAAGLNPTTSYWFGQKPNDADEKEEDSDGNSPDVKGDGDTLATENQTAMN